MATTTNYSWTTPDDTDLVKDGAGAIRTIGTSIDTTTKNLNPSTTLGDIEYRSSTANTNTRLGIGTTGQILTVTGGVPAWATPSAGGAITLINTGGTTLTGGSTTVSSIPTTYKTLVVVVKDICLATAAGVYARFNGDTGNNYYPGPDTSLGSLGAAGTTNTLTQRNYGQMTIPQYSDASGTQVAVWQGYDNFNDVDINKTFWYNKSAAITSITWIALGTTFSNGSIWVYGVS